MSQLIKVADLTPPQKSVVESVPRGLKLMRGPAGTGKTTAGVRRMLRLLTKDKVFANEILVLVPQKALGLPYQSAIDDPQLDPGGRVTVTTLSGLSQRIVNLFFPLAAEHFGFRDPTAQPIFLSLETAQYHMAYATGQIITDRAYFDSVAVARNRLYSQLIDNLNKAALVGFPHTQLAERLIGAWGEKDPAQETIYQQAQECVEIFRAHCLANNLIDFSLQVELFNYLWQKIPVQDQLITRYRHLIVDNVEEDTPIAHDILLGWLPKAESGLIIMDEQAGYRRFLGAAPTSAERLAALVTTNRDSFYFSESDSLVASDAIQALSYELAITLDQTPTAKTHPTTDPRIAVGFEQPRYYTEMLHNISDEIATLVHEKGVVPSEIVVLAPFLSDSLRYLLTQMLTERDIPVRSHRPSRALREEPAASALLTWAQLAHPSWNMPPTSAAVTATLIQSIEGIDHVRAKLATVNLYRQNDFSSFDELASGIQERLTYSLGESLQQLYQWLITYRENPTPEIDVFWSRLFGELLTKPGFGYRNRAEKAEITANLIDSAQKFRRMMSRIPGYHDLSISQEYIHMVSDGVIADQYLRSWQPESSEETVLLAPAYTFLMTNRPVNYQFWLNVGGAGWWERLYQPLTHPYVLTRDWQGEIWTDAHEYHARNETLYRLVLGLLRRCRVGIYLGFSELGEQGFESRGTLLEAFQRTLRRLNIEDNTT